MRSIFIGQSQQFIYNSLARVGYFDRLFFPKNSIQPQSSKRILYTLFHLTMSSSNNGSAAKKRKTGNGKTGTMRVKVSTSLFTTYCTQLWKKYLIPTNIQMSKEPAVQVAQNHPLTLFSSMFIPFFFHFLSYTRLDLHKC